MLLCSPRFRGGLAATRIFSPVCYPSSHATKVTMLLRSREDDPRSQERYASVSSPQLRVQTVSSRSSESHNAAPNNDEAIAKQERGHRFALLSEMALLTDRRCIECASWRGWAVEWRCFDFTARPLAAKSGVSPIRSRVSADVAPGCNSLQPYGVQ